LIILADIVITDVHFVGYGSMGENDWDLIDRVTESVTALAGRVYSSTRLEHGCAIVSGRWASEEEFESARTMLILEYTDIHFKIVRMPGQY
jgi:hypothetical protein